MRNPLNHFSDTAKRFSLIYRFFNEDNYKAFLCNASSVHSSGSFSGMVVVSKTTSLGFRYTDLIYSSHQDQYTIMQDAQGDTLYDFFLANCNDLPSEYIAVRKTYGHLDLLDKIIEIIETNAKLESAHSEILVKQNMCIQMIPIDIMYRLLEESNFLDCDKTHPKIRKLISLSTKRFHNYYTGNKQRINLFTKRGLLDFTKYGQLTDHFIFFRPFTKEEIKQILQFVLDNLRNNDSFKLHLLTNDYYLQNIEFTYYQDHSIWLFDGCSGYGPDYYDCVITSKPFLDLADDFINNVVLKQFIYPEEETISFLEQLIDSVNV